MLRAQQELREIVELIRTVRPAEADKRMRALLTTLTRDELRALDLELRKTIGAFLPKRRAALHDLLERANAADNATAAAERIAEAMVESGHLFDAEPPKELEDQLVETLKELGDRHIFQWSTYYRDELAPLFESLVRTESDALRHGNSSLASFVRTQFAEHTYSIAGRGDHYTLRAGQEHRSIALSKSLNGLQRFLELPIEFYSALSGSITTAQSAVALRRVASSIVAGIVEGYGSAQFDDEEGWHVLGRVPRAWVHYVGFMSADDLIDIADHLLPSPLGDALHGVVAPILQSIDELVVERRLNCSALPVLGQLDGDLARLTIALEGARSAGARLVEIQCYLDPSSVHIASLEEAASRHVALVVARLRPDVGDWASSRDILRQIVVNTAQLGNEGASIARRAKDVLGLAFATDLEAAGTDAPLNYNFARTFPLHNPFLHQYFHVVRPSVRELLGRFDRRNGVRLWCSVRRSGKTTACFDLGTTTGRSTVVSQTCDRTGQEEDSDLFYRMVVDALTRREQLPPAFFTHAVERVSPVRRPNEIRYVFVLDEYETLFERLRLAVLRDPELRYSVVQPLLNQMVAFTRDNLLVFIGQRPDAHFLFMDQNQLSAYLEQDSFPLFEHRAGWSEFTELIRKVASERVPFESAFVDAVYTETAGHPFLTVKVVIDYFDWLIEQRRSMRGLQLTAEDFNAFRSEWLTPRRLGSAQEYQFFQQAISEAISQVGRIDTPWLFAIYSVLRQMAVDFEDTFSCTRDEFIGLCERLGLGEEFGYPPDQLLGSGAQANFFGFSDEKVWARIPLLARIARTARPKLSW